MVDKITKFIAKSLYSEKLLILLEDLKTNNLAGYDLKPLRRFKNTFRVRIWTVRIIFEKKNNQNILKKIDNRGDVY